MVVPPANGCIAGSTRMPLREDVGDRGRGHRNHRGIFSEDQKSLWRRSLSVIVPVGTLVLRIRVAERVLDELQATGNRVLIFHILPIEGTV